MSKPVVDQLLRKFKYDDQRVEHLLGIFDDLVGNIKDYDDQFELDERKDEKVMLAGYQNTGFGILLSMYQLGYLTNADFHHRMHAIHLVYFKKTGY